MAFFKRKLGPVELFERALKDKQTARQRLFERTGLAEKVLEEKRAEAERLAVAGASNSQARPGGSQHAHGRGKGQEASRRTHGVGRADPLD